MWLGDTYWVPNELYLRLTALSIENQEFSLRKGEWGSVFITDLVCPVASAAHYD